MPNQVLLAFAVVFVVLERLFPARRRSDPRPPLGLRNLLFVAFFLAEGAAATALTYRYLAWLGRTGWAPVARLGVVPEVVVSVLALDLTQYWMHRLTHAVPALWRVHRVHHADRDMDVSTGFLFHPLEIPLYQPGRYMTMTLLGCSPLGFTAFTVLMMLALIAQHANLRHSAESDRAGRLLFATADMHRAHHSADLPLTNSNYGVIFSFWDRLFGTYAGGPDPESLRLGLDDYPSPADTAAARLLALPFEA